MLDNDFIETAREQRMNQELNLEEVKPLSVCQISSQYCYWRYRLEFAEDKLKKVKKSHRDLCKQFRLNEGGVPYGKLHISPIFPSQNRMVALVEILAPNDEVFDAVDAFERKLSRFES